MGVRGIEIQYMREDISKYLDFLNSIQFLYIKKLDFRVIKEFINVIKNIVGNRFEQEKFKE